jgi:hypothetical protein
MTLLTAVCPLDKWVTKECELTVVANGSYTVMAVECYLGLYYAMYHGIL